MPDKTVESKVSVRAIVFTLLSVGLLYWTISTSGLRWSDLSLTGTEWGYLSLSALVLLVTIWVQSMRVKIPWETWKPVRKIDSLNGLLIGNFYNCILPGNLGEGVRAWHFKRKNNVPFAAALGSLGVEKYIDAVNFLLYCVILMIFYYTDGRAVFLITSLCLAIGFVFILYLVIITNRKIEKKLMGMLLLLLTAGRWLYKVHYYVKDFLRNMNKRQIARYLLWGYLMFALNVLQYYLVMKASHMPDAIVNVKIAFLVAVSMVMVFIIPSAPGNAGVLHFGIYTVLVSCLRSYHVPASESVLRSLALYTVYLHLSNTIPEVVAGGLTLIKERKWIF